MSRDESTARMALLVTQGGFLPEATIKGHGGIGKLRKERTDCNKLPLVHHVK